MSNKQQTQEQAMQKITRSPMTVSQHADQITRRTFQNRAMRDAVAAELVKRGYKVRKSSVRNQRLHPEYVQDFVGTYETGYQTHWACLYELFVLA